METDVKREKKYLREKFLFLRDMIPEEVRIKKSKIIVEKISKLSKFVSGEKIMLYYPFRGEVDLLSMVKDFNDKTFYFPVVDFENKKIVVKEYSEPFKKNRFGIYEPVNGKELENILLLDMIVVPGIVFDTNCYRIGYGGGYYDKFLYNLPVFSVGVCFDEQLIEKIPVEKNDVQVDMVITDKKEVYKN